jgi:hypothetical protein
MPEGEQAMVTAKFGVVQCIHCGYLQGREIAGTVFKFRGEFKTVVCFNCKKSIPLTIVSVLFKSDSAEAAHAWLVAYKTKIVRGA